MMMNPEELLKEYLLGLADDEFILGHRASEWCGRAPIIEEDIAFANLALDELGHASAWYGVLAELSADDPEALTDRLVYWRDASDYRNIIMVELPRGDWAFSMLRQFLFDAAETVRLDALSTSSQNLVVDAATRIRNEEVYHFRHTSAWVKRLGLGTEESHWRMQSALDQLWPYCSQLFSLEAGSASLVEEALIPAPDAAADAWKEKVIPILLSSRLEIPKGESGPSSRREHTPHLEVLLAELQSVARQDPTARW